MKRTVATIYKRSAFFIFQFSFFLLPIIACSQGSQIIDPKESERIISVLASDEMKGRRTGSEEIKKAAQFIASEFQKAGLQTFNDNDFLQEFEMLRPRMKELKYEVDGAGTDVKNLIVVTSQEEVKVDEKSGFEVVKINAGENLTQRARAFAALKGNHIVMVDPSHESQFQRLMGLKRQMFSSPHTKVFLLGTELPSRFSIKAEHSFEKTPFANVVGYLPGKSRKNEFVIFSGHYDHVGVGKPVEGDSIYNGANDDAAGTTAVIQLAKHFKQLGNNERSILFVAFTAEEVGGFGSQYFSQSLSPDAVVAMFNIEMIGTESKWGTNSAFITGYERSNLGEIMQKNLKGSAFTFQPDPYPQQNLFYRSDNATLARLGVPAHTISTAKMDAEPHYHKPSDEVKTLNLVNMARIIEAIAVSSRSVVMGVDTPSRVTQ